MRKNRGKRVQKAVRIELKLSLRRSANATEGVQKRGARKGAIVRSTRLWVHTKTMYAGISDGP